MNCLHLVVEVLKISLLEKTVENNVTPDSQEHYYRRLAKANFSDSTAEELHRDAAADGETHPAGVSCSSRFPEVDETR